ncbi:unnamed protein product [Caenorhabditis nigoni]
MTAFKLTVLAVTLAVANCGLIKLPINLGATSNGNIGATATGAVHGALNAAGHVLSSATEAAQGALNVAGNALACATGAIDGAVHIAENVDASAMIAAQLDAQFSAKLVALLESQGIENANTVGSFAYDFAVSIADEAQAAGNIDVSAIDSIATDFAAKLSGAIGGSVNEGAIGSITAEFAGQLNDLFETSGEVTEDIATLNDEFADEISEQVSGNINDADQVCGYDCIIKAAVQVGVDAAAKGSGAADILTEIAAELRACAYGNADFEEAAKILDELSAEIMANEGIRDGRDVYLIVDNVVPPPPRSQAMARIVKDLAAQLSPKALENGAEFQKVVDVIDQLGRSL